MMRAALREISRNAASEARVGSDAEESNTEYLGNSRKGKASVIVELDGASTLWQPPRNGSTRP